MSENKGHLGTKFLGLFVGILLSTIYAIWKFVQPSFNPVTDLPLILLVEAFFLIIWVAIWVLAELLWRYAHKYSEKFPIE